MVNCSVFAFHQNPCSGSATRAIPPSRSSGASAGYSQAERYQASGALPPLSRGHPGIRTDSSAGPGGITRRNSTATRSVAPFGPVFIPGCRGQSQNCKGLVGITMSQLLHFSGSTLASPFGPGAKKKSRNFIYGISRKCRPRGRGLRTWWPAIY